MTAKATGVSDYGISFLRNQNHVSKNFYQDYVSNVEINIVTAIYYRPLYLDRKKQNVLEDKQTPQTKYYQTEKETSQ